MSDKLPSPCISICQIDPLTDFCRGCYRTRQEIARWPALDGTEQRLILETLKERRTAQTGIGQRRGNARRFTG